MSDINNKTDGKFNPYEALKPLLEKYGFENFDVSVEEFASKVLMCKESLCAPRMIRCRAQTGIEKLLLTEIQQPRTCFMDPETDQVNYARILAIYVKNALPNGKPFYRCFCENVENNKQDIIIANLLQIGTNGEDLLQLVQQLTEAQINEITQLVPEQVEQLLKNPFDEIEFTVSSPEPVVDKPSIVLVQGREKLLNLFDIAFQNSMLKTKLNENALVQKDKLKKIEKSINFDLLEIGNVTVDKLKKSGKGKEDLSTFSVNNYLPLALMQELIGQPTDILQLKQFTNTNRVSIGSVYMLLVSLNICQRSPANLNDLRLQYLRKNSSAYPTIQDDEYEELKVPQIIQLSYPENQADIPPANTLNPQLIEQCRSMTITHNMQFQIKCQPNDVLPHDSTLQEVPYELMDVLCSCLKQNGDVSSFLQQFATKLMSSVQQSIIQALRQLNVFESFSNAVYDSVFKEYEFAEINSLFENPSKKDDQPNFQILQNILVPEIWLRIAFDEEIMCFVMIRVLLAILEVFLLYNCQPEIFDKPDQNAFMYPTITVFQSIGVQISKLYSEINKTPKSPFFLPFKFFNPALVSIVSDTQEKSKQKDQLLYDIAVKSYLGKYFEKFNKFVQECAAKKENTVPRTIPFCSATDCQLAAINQFTLYTFNIGQQVAVIFPQCRIFTVMSNNIYAPVEIELARLEAANKLLFDRVRVNWLRAHSMAVQNGQYAKQNEVRRLACLYELTTILKPRNTDEIREKFETTLITYLNNDITHQENEEDLNSLQLAKIVVIKRLLGLLRRSYKIPDNQPFDIRNVSAQQMDALLKQSFQYFEIINGQNNVIEKVAYQPYKSLQHYQLAVNYIQAHFKYDLMSLFFELIYTQHCLSDNIDQYQYGLCEALHSALAVYDLTDEAIAPIMHQFIHQLIEMQKTAQPMSNADLSKTIDQQTHNYMVQLNTFQHNWHGFDFNCNALNLALVFQFATVTTIENAQKTINIISDSFKQINLVKRNIKRIFQVLSSLQLNENTQQQYYMFKYIQLKILGQYDITEMSLLDGLKERLQVEQVPSILFQQFLAFNNQGNKVIKIVKSPQFTINSLQTSTNFYQKKRTFPFNLQTNNMDQHSYATANQNKAFQQTLQSIKTQLVDFIFKYELIKAFQNINQRYDGSQISKYRANITFLMFYKLIQPVFLQKSSFNKILTSQIVQCNTDISKIAAEQYREIIQNFDFTAFNNLLTNFFLLHIDQICYFFVTEDSTEKQFFCNYKKLISNQNKELKQFSELFSYSSTSYTPFQLDSNQYLLNQLADKLNKKSHQILDKSVKILDNLLLSEQMIQFIQVQDLVELQKELKITTQPYTEVMAPVEQPAEVKEEKVEQIEPKKDEQPTNEQIPSTKNDINSKKDKRKRKQEENQVLKITKEESQTITEKAHNGTTQEHVESEKAPEQVNQSVIEIDIKTQPSNQYPPKELEIAVSDQQNSLQHVNQDDQGQDADQQKQTDQKLAIVKEQAEQQQILNQNIQQNHTYTVEFENIQFRPDTTNIVLSPSLLAQIGQYTSVLQHSINYSIQLLMQTNDPNIHKKFRYLFPLSPQNFICLLLKQPIDGIISTFETNQDQISTIISVFNAYPDLYYIYCGVILKQLFLLSPNLNIAFKVVNVKYESAVFEQKLEILSKSINNQAQKQFLDYCCLQFDKNDIQVPFIVGLGGEYSKCPVFLSSGCNIMFSFCQHEVSVWYVMQQIYMQFQQYENLPYEQFRNAFLQLIQFSTMKCPSCSHTSPLQLRRRSAIVNPAFVDAQLVNYIAQLTQKCDINDNIHKIVVEIDGIGYLTPIKSCCYINQYIDELI